METITPYLPEEVANVWRPVLITDVCGWVNKMAADHSLASLEALGGSVQSDRSACAARR